MKKIVFYPILFSINPILLLLAKNISDVPLSQLFPVIVIAPFVAAGLMGLVNKWLQDVHRAGFVVFSATFWFFHYGTVHLWANNIHIGSISLGAHWIFFPLWTLLFILFSSRLLWRKITSPETITMFLNIVGMILVAFSVLRITLDLAPRYTTRPNLTNIIQSTIQPSSITDLPDVYYIIVDGYARADILQELYHYDNSSFIQSLKNKGFVITTQSQSNYVQTALSIASSLNMEYLSGVPKMVPDRGQLIGMIQQSQVGAIFKSLGYKIVGFSTGYQPTDMTNADIYLSSSRLGKSHDLEALLLINSAADILIEQGWIDVPITRYSAQQERINYTFSTLSNEVPLIKDPKMVFTHIIAPHPPFIFNQTDPIKPDEFYILADGEQFPGGKEYYPREYVDQLIYINRHILQAIDNILAKSNIPPIIIIQADHGSGLYLDRSSLENTCLLERFSIFNAYYLPQGTDIKLKENTTPVNTFRIILNTYFGFKFELLEDKEYFSTWEEPYNFIDVTNKTQTPCNTQ